MAPRADRSPSPSPSPSHLQAPGSPKASFLSPTPSFEADDEGTASNISDMEHDHGSGRARAPQYPGDDTRLTSSKELLGWYSYAWAAEVFVVCGIGSFLPITLEQLARERGVLLSDHTTPCGPSTDISEPSRPPSTALSSLLIRTATTPADKGQCVVNILGAEINTASFAMYTFSISVLLQALVIVSMSGAADHGRYRKTLLLSFAFVGAAATMLFVFVTPSIYIFGAFLAIISNTSFGASSVLLNSFLPLLVRHHPSVQSDPKPSPSYSSDSLTEPLLEQSSPSSSSSPLTPPSKPTTSTTTTTPALTLSTRISGYGMGIGYLSAVLFQLLAITLVLLTSSSLSTLRLILLSIGLWWALFTLPAALFLRPRPGPPLPNPHRTWLSYFTHSWRALGTTVYRARRLRDLTLFLLAWFLLSDALATVSGTAVLFAKTELGMPLNALAFINVIATLTGVLGALFWPRVAALLGLSPIQTIVANILLFELIPLYGLLGYLPFIRRLGYLGLQQEWEMYLLGAVYGFVLGGLGAYCRSLYSELIPPGSEAAFFALYAITDKGSSVFGPAVVGAITDRYGGIRPAFVFLAALIAVAVPFMAGVDVGRGRVEGGRLARELEGEGEREG